MKQTVYIYRGLPASGKSTDAEARMHVMHGQVVRVERDLLRDQLYGNRYYKRPSHWDNMTDEEFKIYLSERENTITSVQVAMANAALKAGKSVIVSDTNLPATSVKNWIKVAQLAGADYEIINFDHISVDECINRDKNRSNSVGEEVIRNMYSRFFVKGKIPAIKVDNAQVLDINPYENPDTLPTAIIVDIDGTVAKMNGRSPYEWMRVGEDEPVEAVIDAVRSAMLAGNHVIFMSGRDSSCRGITEDWLTTATGIDSQFFELYMRAEGDNRKDDLVKYELFNENVRDKYHVKYVLDDRDQVVAMWRKLGLACFQVEYGAF